MSALRDLSVSRKIGLAFGAVCLLTALFGIAAFFGFLKVNAAAKDIVEDSIPSLRVLGDVRYSISTIRRTDALLLLCDTPECAARLTPKRKNYIAAY
jgi:methyl-accepting chemotaxis protein